MAARWYKFNEQIKRITAAAEKEGFTVDEVDYDPDILVVRTTGSRIPRIVTVRLSVNLKLSMEPDEG